MLATVMESSPTVKQNQPPPKEKDEQNQPPEEDVEQKQLPIPTEKTSIVDLTSSPSKRVKRGKPDKNEGKTAMVDLASSLLKGAMVDLVSSPSKGVPFVRYIRGKTRAQRKVMMVLLESEPIRIQSIDRNEVRVLFNDKVLKKIHVYFMLGSCFNLFLFKNHKIFNSS
jgi:hypothetical protein